VIVYMNECAVSTTVMVRESFAVKGIWAVWDSIITVAMVMLLGETCYVHVRLYSEA
jgi:hypothetical protein